MTDEQRSFEGASADAGQSSDAGTQADSAHAAATDNLAQQQHDAYKRQHDEHAWAMLAHLSVFSGGFIPFGHIFGPLVVWLVKREQYALVDDQGRESLNFQISMSIYTLILVVVAVVAALSLAAGEQEAGMLGALIAAGVGLLLISLLDLIFVIIASVKSYRGERYRYPLTIRFLS
jgi:uncharacterized Tic20 family protein